MISVEGEKEFFNGIINILNGYMEDIERSIITVVSIAFFLMGNIFSAIMTKMGITGFITYSGKRLIRWFTYKMKILD